MRRNLGRQIAGCRAPACTELAVHSIQVRDDAVHSTDTVSDQRCRAAIRGHSSRDSERLDSLHSSDGFLRRCGIADVPLFAPASCRGQNVGADFQLRWQATGSSLSRAPALRMAVKDPGCCCPLQAADCEWIYQEVRVVLGAVSSAHGHALALFLTSEPIAASAWRCVKHPHL